MRYLGVDLAWAEHARGRSANASGVVALDPSGNVVDAGWTAGLDQTIDWIEGSSTEAARCSWMPRSSQLATIIAPARPEQRRE